MVNVKPIKAAVDEHCIKTGTNYTELAKEMKWSRSRLHQALDREHCTFKTACAICNAIDVDPRIFLPEATTNQ